MVKIPLSQGAQYFNITLGDYSYRLSLAYRKATYGGWFLDIDRADETVSLHGIPLVCGVDLLGQFQYKGLGHLYAFVDGKYVKTPSWDDMGKSVDLYWEE